MNILIISYHFPPLNHIASYRTRALSSYLHKSGIFPTIVTHDWREEGQIGTERVQEEDCGTYRLIRLPHRSSKFRIDKAGKARLIWDWVRGDFDNRGTLRQSGDIFRQFLRSFLDDNRNRFDLILGIYSPFFPLRLAQSLSKEFDIPYIADFRDLIDNRQLSDFRIPPAFRVFVSRLKKVNRTVIELRLLPEFLPQGRFGRDVQ